MTDRTNCAACSAPLTPEERHRFGTTCDPCRQQFVRQWLIVDEPRDDMPQDDGFNFKPGRDIA